MTEGPAKREVRAPAIVVLIVRLTAIVGRMSPYRLLSGALKDRTRSAIATQLLADRPHDGVDLVADDQIDLGAIYVLCTLATLLVAFLIAPAWTNANGFGHGLSVAAVTVAVWRYVDLVAYHAGILLDPRQDLLRSPPRSLVLLVFNVVELTLAGATVFHVMGHEGADGLPLDRVDAWIRAFDLVALLEPVRRATTPLVAAQVLVVAAGVLLLVVGVGVLLGLMTQSFRSHNS